MQTQGGDLNGSVPEESPVALLLADVINDKEYPSGDRLLPQIQPAGCVIAALAPRAFHLSRVAAAAAQMLRCARYS